MAPSKRSRADDDFVLTLSDNEDDFPQDIGSDDGDDFASKKPTANGSVTKTLKRKRGDAPVAENGSTSKKAKKGKKGKNMPEKVEEDEEEEEDTYPVVEEDAGDDDGALNSDFEFDVGGFASGVVEDFDGWTGVNGDEDVAKGGDKKAVDIDDIIARRRERAAKKAAKLARRKELAGSDEDEFDGFGEEGSVGEGAEEEEGPDVEEGTEEAIDAAAEMEDDELLAEDGFGMGVKDGEVESEEEDEDEDEEKSEGDDEDGADSDDESVASAVPHPDDVASDSDESDAEDEVEKAKREAFFAPEEPQPASAKKSGSSNNSFQDFSLSRPILRGLAAVGFSSPTPIQRKTIPVALLGKDIVGGAVTGSGKTGAFIIPILERLLYRPRKVPTSRVVILMPTRELAVQCFNVATKLASFTDITFCQLVGGFSLREQENILRKRPDVIIATPGRFIDHMRNSASFTVDTLEILVLDEADRMLEDGFADELNEILTTIPKSRQTMLFSATMTDTVDKLIRVGMNRPARLMVDQKKSTVAGLTQEFVRLRPGRENMRLGYLLLLANTVYTQRTIVFFRQKKEAHRVRIVFGLLGLKAAELHGSMSQDQRIKSVEAFRDGNVSFLLATDLASRGLDIKGVETVINYEAPQSHEIYLHRVGRTARAGRSGRACTIAAEPDRKVVKAAVKAGRAQGAKIVSRVVEPTAADEWQKKADDMENEIEEILKEEKDEKQLAQAEMQVRRGENILGHHDEIMSRPKRTWFETETEKRASKQAGLVELNGPGALKGKEKKKLSNKDKKRMDATRERKEGRMWKKGKGDAQAASTPGGAKNKGKKGGDASKKGGKPKGAGKPRRK